MLPPSSSTFPPIRRVLRAGQVDVAAAVGKRWAGSFASIEEVQSRSHVADPGAALVAARRAHADAASRRQRIAAGNGTRPVVSS